METSFAMIMLFPLKRCLKMRRTLLTMTIFWLTLIYIYFTIPDVDVVDFQNVDYKYFPLPDDSFSKVVDAFMSNLTEAEKGDVQRSLAKYGYNKLVSDRIGLRRNLTDIRSQLCKEPGRYLSKLPKTDIIIVFHDETFSALTRTIYSILDQSPLHLISSIILVDDFSSKHETSVSVEDYWAKRASRIKVIRTQKREGLIRAKMIGFQHGTAPVATFLDAHCECVVGWLEPLLDRIARDPNTIACPTIDTLDVKTFKYKFLNFDTAFVGAFSWDLQFKWMWVQPEEDKRRKNNMEPVRNPTMAGGLFSITRKLFIKLGMYDDQLEIWGGENVELSLKAWMCGSRIEIVPCSRVGHVAKLCHNYNVTSELVWKNALRVTRVWFDEYAKIVELLKPIPNPKIGDLTARLELKRSLKCHSFKWYLDNIYPELIRPDVVIRYGEKWLHSPSKHISRDFTNCLSAQGMVTELINCDFKSQLQKWIYEDNGHLKVRRRKTMWYCLTGVARRRLFLNPCVNSPLQKWQFSNETHSIFSPKY